MNNILLHWSFGAPKDKNQTDVKNQSSLKVKV